MVEALVSGTEAVSPEQVMVMMMLVFKKMVRMMVFKKMGRMVVFKKMVGMNSRR